MVKSALLLVMIATVSVGALAQDTKPSAPSQSSPSANPQGCDHRTCTYNLASGKTSGDTVRGSRTIVATGLNVLRYDYSWNSTVTFGAAPDLWSKLATISVTSPTAPPAPAQKSTVTAAGATQISPSADVEAAIKQADDLIAQIASHIQPVTNSKTQIQSDATGLSGLQVDAANATAKVTAAGKALTDFLGTSTGDPGVLIPQIKDQLADTAATPASPADSTFIAGTKAAWADPTDITRIHDSAQKLSSELDAWKTDFATYVPQETVALEAQKSTLNALANKKQQQLDRTTDANTKTQLQTDINAMNGEINGNLKNAETDLTSANRLLNTWEIPTNTQTLSGISDLDVAGAKYTAYRSAQDSLVTWKRRMQTVLGEWNDFTAKKDGSKDPFTSAWSADCGFAFSRTKTTALTLSQTDRMPGGATASSTVLSVSVECTSPFTVSAGMALFFVPDKEFGIQSVPATQGSGSTTTNEVAVTSSSGFHPVPIGMVHARLWEPSDLFSLHASFGVAADIRSQSAGGSDPDYLIGPSVALFRTMFFTPGVMIGPEVNLGRGLTAGETVPSMITTAPVQKTYKAGFGFAITFTKP